MYSPANLAAIEYAWQGLLSRNKREVDSFEGILREYEDVMRRCSQLKSKCHEQGVEILSMREEKAGLHAEIQAQKESLIKASAPTETQVRDLQSELATCYKTHSHLSQQMVQAAEALHAVKEEVQAKNRAISDLQDCMEASRVRISELEGLVRKKDDAVELASAEAARCRMETAAMNERLKKIDDENRMLLNRWMEMKMTEADKVNEANAMYEDMLQCSKVGMLEELARLQVDGVVRNTEAAVSSNDAAMAPPQQRTSASTAPPLLPLSPSMVSKTRHQGGCLALAFDPSGTLLVSGGADMLVRVWDTRQTGKASWKLLQGCTAAVLDLAVSADSTAVLAACGDRNLYFWDIETERVKQCLAGHSDKVTCADISRDMVSRGCSASGDRSIRVWDLDRGYCTSTLLCHSVTHGLAYAGHGSVICSGHSDGNLRLWDLRAARLANEVVAHSSAVTSVAVSQSGNSVLSCGRDNILNMFDMRTLEVKSSVGGSGFRTASNWVRACISPNDEFVCAGSGNGCTYVWDIEKQTLAACLTVDGHESPVLASAWGNRGAPLATGDKAGVVTMWR